MANHGNVDIELGIDAPGQVAAVQEPVTTAEVHTVYYLEGSTRRLRCQYKGGACNSNFRCAQLAVHLGWA